MTRRRIAHTCWTAPLLLALVLAACNGIQNPSAPDETAFSAAKRVVPAAASDSPCELVPSDLVAWWPGDGNAEDIVGDNDGSLLSGADYASGLVAEAFDFDGTGEVVIPSAPELNVQTFTLEAWVYPTEIDGKIDMILNKEAVSQNPIQYEIGIRGTHSPLEGSLPVGNFAFYIGGISPLPSSLSGWVDGHGQVPLNTWTHVALTFDGSTARAYVNGQATRILTDLIGTVNVSSGPVKIGSRSDVVVNGSHPYERFEGSIDEVAIYNRALTPEEIGNIHASGSGGKYKQQILPDLIAGVASLKASGTLNKGQANALTAKLQAAQKKLGQCNADAALGPLGAFANQVGAFLNSGILSPAEGQPLLDAVNEIIYSLDS